MIFKSLSGLLKGRAAIGAALVFLLLFGGMWARMAWLGSKIDEVKTENVALGIEVNQCLASMISRDDKITTLEGTNSELLAAIEKQESIINEWKATAEKESEKRAAAERRRAAAARERDAAIRNTHASENGSSSLTEFFRGLIS